LDLHPASFTVRGGDYTYRAAGTPHGWRYFSAKNQPSPARPMPFVLARLVREHYNFSVCFRFALNGDEEAAMV